jgi:hypothetical protein
MITRFLGIRLWWNGVHGLRLFLHCRSPVNFPVSSANGLEFAKFQAGLLCSCTRRVEMMNPVRGTGYDNQVVDFFRTELVLFSVDITKF